MSHKSTTKSHSVGSFRRAIGALPADKSVDTPGKWYKTQKEHWLGWLRDYDGPGYYNRKVAVHRDARFAYNHINEAKMLLWLIAAAGVSPSLVRAARLAAEKEESFPSRSAAVRRHVPWEMVESALWPKPERNAPDDRLPPADRPIRRRQRV